MYLQTHRNERHKGGKKGSRVARLLFPKVIWLTLVHKDSSGIPRQWYELEFELAWMWARAAASETGGKRGSAKLGNFTGASEHRRFYGKVAKVDNGSSFIDFSIDFVAWRAVKSCRVDWGTKKKKKRAETAGSKRAVFVIPCNSNQAKIIIITNPSAEFKT